MNTPWKVNNWAISVAWTVEDASGFHEASSTYEYIAFLGTLSTGAARSTRVVSREDCISHGRGTMGEFPYLVSVDSDVGDVWFRLLGSFHRVTHKLSCHCPLRLSPYLAQFPF
jgi:hypothetical protein